MGRKNSAPDKMYYTHLRDAKMCPPAVPLSVVSIGRNRVGPDAGTEWEHVQPVLAIVCLIEDHYVRQHRGQFDVSDVPEYPVSAKNLRDENWRPDPMREGELKDSPYFDYLIDGEFGPGLHSRLYTAAANSVHLVVPTAELPLSNERREYLRAELAQKLADSDKRDAERQAADEVRQRELDAKREAARTKFAASKFGTPKPSAN